MRETLLSFLDDCIARGEETAVVHWRGLRISRWSYARLASCAFQFARELEARDIGAGRPRALLGGEQSRVDRGFLWLPVAWRGRSATRSQVRTGFRARVQQQVSAKLLLADDPQPQLDVPRLLTQQSRRRHRPTFRQSVTPASTIKPGRSRRDRLYFRNDCRTKRCLSHASKSPREPRSDRKGVSRSMRAGSGSSIHCVFSACCR